MDEALMALLETLVEIEREFGPDLFRNVVELARIAVAAEIMVEAERKTLRERHRTTKPAEVIRFPTKARLTEGHSVQTEEESR